MMGSQKKIVQHEWKRLSYLLSKPKHLLSEKELKELNELLEEQKNK